MKDSRKIKCWHNNNLGLQEGSYVTNNLFAVQEFPHASRRWVPDAIFSKSLISLELLFPQHCKVTHREDNFGSSAARSVFWIEILGQEKRTEEMHLCPFRGVMCKYRLLSWTHNLNAQSTLWTTGACALSDTLGLMKPLIHSTACSSDQHCLLNAPPRHWEERERSPHSPGPASPPSPSNSYSKECQCHSKNAQVQSEKINHGM